MHLDMLTMAAVNVTVTAVLGLVLIFTWGRERANIFVGWWGLAQLIMSAGVLIAVVLWHTNHAALVPIGTASMILANALQWKAACQFEHRRAHPLWVAIGPIAFLLAAPSGLLGAFDGRLILLCTLIATYNFAAAIELAHGYRERLRSRWPAVIMLIAAGALYLSWLPLILTLPIHEAGLVFVSGWFATIVLVNLSVRTALAFIVLAMAKERRELERRLDALTDPLTGLPNRRALIEAAEELRQQGDPLKADPISVLLFDLDHFKEINDAYGHRFGDNVLKLFAATLSKQLDGNAFLARLGGEEFAAILRGANPVVSKRRSRFDRRLKHRRPWSTAWLSGVRSALARPRPPKSSATSACCFIGPTPPSIWRRAPGATAWSWWDRIKYPISTSSARRFGHRRRNSMWTPRSPNITAV